VKVCNELIEVRQSKRDGHGLASDLDDLGQVRDHQQLQISGHFAQLGAGERNKSPILAPRVVVHVHDDPYVALDIL
jgi:hypothetical protein